MKVTLYISRGVSLANINDIPTTATQRKDCLCRYALASKAELVQVQPLRGHGIHK